VNKNIKKRVYSLFAKKYKYFFMNNKYFLFY
jgi:hypothetical protein